MKRIMLLFALVASTAQAISPKDFFDLAASDANWSIAQDGQNYCAQIAENARRGSWPATPKAPLKYISTLEYTSDEGASFNKIVVQEIKGIKANQAWHNYKDAFSRLYDGIQNPGYVFNIVLINTFDDDGPTGGSLICVGIFTRR